MRPSAPGSIAVLPFRLLGTEASDEYLGRHGRRLITTEQYSQITVRPTSAVIKYADLRILTARRGRELGVDSVLEGTIRVR